MRLRLLHRSALLSWIAVLLVLSLFLVLIVPMQRDMLQQRLVSSAELIATSIHQVTVTAIVVEDYSPVIEHCLGVVQGGGSVLFIKLTRRDGFCLVHTRDGWRHHADGESWSTGDQPSAIEFSELAGQEVFRLTRPLQYSGIDWGWIHIGLSLEGYHADVAAMYERLALIGGLCLVAASLVSLLFARRLSQPILHLSHVTQRLASGDLEARALIESGDEVEALAQAFNRMADNLQQAQQDLERRVQERTAELSQANRGLTQQMEERRAAELARARAEDELSQQRALKMRSDRLRSLGEMAAGIAHELNQPLTGVRGLAELGLDSETRGLELEEGEYTRTFSDIIEQADRMARIIEHVRLFAREAGKPETAIVEANDVARDATDLLSAQFRSRGLSLELDLGDGLPQVDVNRYSLEEAVINLLVNARDAVEERRLTLIDSSRVVLRTYESGGRVILEVEDEGAGISQDLLVRVFEPFYTTKEPDKGTGLGLSISKAIIEGFDGALELYSTPGVGTRAVISLPAAG